MRRLVFILIVLSVSLHVCGQSISQKEAEGLRNSLNTKITDTSRINTLLKLAEFNVFKPGEFKADLDSADMFIKQASKLNATLRLKMFQGIILLDKCYLNNERNIPNEKATVFEAVKLFQATDDKYDLARAYIELSRCYNAEDKLQASKINEIYQSTLLLLNTAGNWRQRESRLNEMLERGDWGRQDKLNFLMSAILTYRRLHNKINELWARKEAADLHFQEGKGELATKELLQILDEYKAINYPAIFKTYDLIGAVYFNSGDLSKALSYGLEALRHLQTAADSTALPVFYQRIANIYGTLGMKEKFVDINIKILNYFIATHQLGSIYYILGQITTGLVHLGKPQEALKLLLSIKIKYLPMSNYEKLNLAKSLGMCYYGLKKNDLAVKYFNEMARLNRLERDEQVRAVGEFSIGMAYVFTKKYESARSHLIYALKKTKVGKADPGNAEIYMGLYKIDSASGNYRSALKYFAKYKLTNDSIFDISRNQQIEKLQITYETEQRKKDIILLQNKIRLKDIIVEHTKNNRNWIIAAAIMLLLMLGVSINRYRLKQKSNQLLEQQREEINLTNKNLKKVIYQKDHLLSEKEWLIKEVHHRVKNNLHTVICLLESQAAYLEDDALKAIENSQHRIYAMSLIHQMLYQTEDVKGIDIAVYIPEFIQYLKDSFGTNYFIRFQLEIVPLILGISQAIPLALIINEAVTNSIKYAFAGRSGGEIKITIVQAKNQINVTIADNGIGIDPDIVGINSNSLGLKLMNGLSEDINALISFENDDGTKITIVLQEDTLCFDNTNLIPDIHNRAYS